MRYTKTVIFILLLVTGISFSTINAAQTSGSASLDFMSNYIWRGQKLSNASVLQPSVGITYEGFGVNLWTNYDAGTNEHTETDLTLHYTFSRYGLSLDGGYIYYALDGANDTQEIYLSMSYDILLNPSLGVYYDFDEGDGAFIVLSIGHSFDLREDLSLDISASASFNASNLVMGTDAGGDEFNDFYNGEISASFTIPVSDSLSISPMVAYSFPLSSDAEDAIEAISDDGDSRIFYGGINLSLNF